MFEKKIIKAIGFDLDETLYPSNPKINDKIRSELARSLLERKQALGSVEKARKFFDERYAVLGSSRKVLIEAGYDKKEAELISNRASSQADIINLIEPISYLPKIIKRLGERYILFLLTSGQKQGAIEKLKVLGISPSYFHYRAYADTCEAGQKDDGSAFNYIIGLTKLKPQQHVYVGNSEAADILPAKKAGMQTISAWLNIKKADLYIPHIKCLEEVFLDG